MDNGTTILNGTYIKKIKYNKDNYRITLNNEKDYLCKNLILTKNNCLSSWDGQTTLNILLDEIFQIDFLKKFNLGWPATCKINLVLKLNK